LLQRYDLEYWNLGSIAGAMIGVVQMFRTTATKKWQGKGVEQKIKKYTTTQRREASLMKH